MSQRLIALLFLCLLVRVTEAQESRPSTPPILIRGGSVVDGTGEPARRADLLIEGSTIVAVEEHIERDGATIIDATGAIVCPGFIDLHSHSDQPLTKDGLRENRSFLTQGCTTVVTGNCGGGHVDVEKYFGLVERHGAGTNVMHLLPQGSIREQAMKGSFERAPTEDELREMKRLITAGMRAGAVGMSTGLIYTPSSFASTEELIELAKVVASFGGIYASHIRGEGDHLLEAIDEAIRIGEESGCRVQVSHMKAVGPKNHGKVVEAAARIEKARARGIRVTADQYPYTASSTSLRALVLPASLRGGSEREFRERLDSPETAKKVRDAIHENLDDRGGAKTILVARFAGDPMLNGKNLEEIATATKRDVIDVVLDIERRGGAQAVAFGMCEEDVVFVMNQPWVATASDGSSAQSDASRPHPRSYGTFPRKIGRYAIEQKALSVEAAIRSASGLPADILGLVDRGYLKPGQAADVVVFDPATFRDRATYPDPHVHSTGVLRLWVNGVETVRDGEPTGTMGGRVLRR